MHTKQFTLAHRDTDVSFLEQISSEWRGLLSSYPDFAEKWEDVDTSICSYNDLAGLLLLAPDSAVRLAICTIVHCRRLVDVMLNAPEQTSPENLALFDQCTAEWTSKLNRYHDLRSWSTGFACVTCAPAMLLEAMRIAPTSDLRHAFREIWCFRETLALTGHQDALYEEMPEQALIYRCA